MSKNRGTMKEDVQLIKLLAPDNEKVKELKSIFKKEADYAGILGPIEYTIASYYKENKKLRDHDVAKAVKDIKLNLDQGFKDVKDPIEQEIFGAAYYALQKKKITKHEFLLVLSYITWSIDNRRWIPDARAYLNWLLAFFGMSNKKEEKEFERQYDELGAMLCIDKDRLNVMKCDYSNVPKQSEEAEEWNKENSEYFAMSDGEKYKYLLACKEDPGCEFANIGLELEKKGEFKKAKKLYKRAIRLYPDDHDGYSHLGMLYKKMKKYARAAANLSAALELAQKLKDEDPTYINQEVIDEIEKELKEIETLRKK